MQTIQQNTPRGGAAPGRGGHPTTTRGEEGREKRKLYRILRVFCFFKYILPRRYQRFPTPVPMTAIPIDAMLMTIPHAVCNWLTRTAPMLIGRLSCPRLFDIVANTTPPVINPETTQNISDLTLMVSPPHFSIPAIP